MSAVRILTLSLFLAVPLVGCEPQLNCDLSAAVSVQVHVQDPAGEEIPGTQVRYRLSADDDFADCLQQEQDWSCGFEESGTFEIEVSADFYDTQLHEVVVSSGECHVISEQLEVTLEQNDCALIEHERAVHLTLSDPNGTSVSAFSGGWASWGYPNADMAAIPCEPDGNGGFYCGDFEAGTYEIAAGSIGFHPVLEVIEVGVHECGGPLVENVEQVLYPTTGACTEVLVSSVELTLRDQQGNLTGAAAPQYRSLYLSDSSFHDCDVVSAGEWTCGWELAGAIEVVLNAAELDDWSTTVFVPTDDCHVIRQTLSVSL
jgi:hypothetical protein